MLKYRHDLKQKSRQLRKTMTDAEQVLWRRLRGKQINGMQFYRQKPLGPYVVDFYSPAARLVVEVDGAQHLEAAGISRDEQRDAYLGRNGLRVLRFDNRQVLLETVAVLEMIDRVTASVLRQIPPGPPFSKRGKEQQQKENSI